jgi:hypothetical protein
MQRGDDTTLSTARRQRELLQSGNRALFLQACCKGSAVAIGTTCGRGRGRGRGAGRQLLCPPVTYVTGDLAGSQVGSTLNAQRRSVSFEEVRNAAAFHGKIRLGRSVAIIHCSSGRQSSIRSAGREQRSTRLSASSRQNRLVEGTAPADRFARRRDRRKRRKDRPRRCGTLRRPSSSRRCRDARRVRPTCCEGCSEETVIAFGFLRTVVRRTIARPPGLPACGTTHPAPVRSLAWT